MWADALGVIREWLAPVVMLLGAFAIFSSMIGIIRFPDPYCRSHALGKGMVFGITILLIGFWLSAETLEVALKALAAIIFQAVTVPVASHLLARFWYYRDDNKKAQETTRKN